MPLPPPKDRPEIPPSKTRRKKAMIALQDLGERLTVLSRERLSRLDLPESLLAAILEAKRLEGKHEARRRQMQYVGRLMRVVDAAAIAARLESLEGDSPQAKARRAQLERLRERFLEDERVLGEILSWAPEADVQHLRVLRRKVLEERQKETFVSEAYRAIYRELKSLVEAHEADLPWGAGEREEREA
ncbi:ribosome biogenesis factor YjgA [Tepidiphilus sp. J10]|uniref:ribosome biogenesis factor YjgA n=1 Tax=Tepidiphilus sp. J10 TaxID=2502185 RepID=UPI00115F2424|nr:ribosome biogenesis factor YjgA [Tepidiphilus sp. J10]